LITVKDFQSEHLLRFVSSTNSMPNKKKTVKAQKPKKKKKKQDKGSIYEELL